MTGRLLGLIVVTAVFISSLPALGQAPAGSPQPPAVSGATDATAVPSPQSRLKTEEIAPGVTRVYTPSVTGKTSVNMYIVAGTSQAMLIDTGYPDDITPEYVSTITKLPLIVVNTHAHPDHSACNEKFGKVYVYPADVNAAKRYSGKCELVPLKDGQVFDLGGKKLEVILTVGHTPGSICLLDTQDKLLFTGDSCNGEVWMHISSIPLETYLKSIKRLMDRKDEYTKLLLGHGTPAAVSVLSDAMTCAQEILDGKAQPPAPAAEQPAGARGARGLNSGASHRVGRVLIRYNPSNLLEKKN